jgi:hypothetical protein
MQKFSSKAAIPLAEMAKPRAQALDQIQIANKT